MKLTATMLRKIIKEEVKRTLREGVAGPDYNSLAAAVAAATKRLEAAEAADSDYDFFKASRATADANLAFFDAFRNAIKDADPETAEAEVARALEAGEAAGMNDDGELGWTLEYFTSPDGRRNK